MTRRNRSNRAVALEFVTRFCAGDVDGLEPLLAPDLRFEGPLHRFDSREAYLASLRSDPPQPADHAVRSVTDDESSVSIYYDYLKPSGTVRIAQLAMLERGRIARLLLVFDTRALTSG